MNIYHPVMFIPHIHAIDDQHIQNPQDARMAYYRKNNLSPHQVIYQLQGNKS